jgi:hypothetical protein
VTLLASATALAALVEGVAPLEDDFPMRLSPDLAAAPWDPWRWVNASPDTPERVAALGPVPAPPGLVRRSLGRSRAVLLWLLASGVDEVRAAEAAAARGARGPELDLHLGARAFVEGDFADAARRWASVPGHAALRALAADLAARD